MQLNHNIDQPFKSLKQDLKSLGYEVNWRRANDEISKALGAGNFDQLRRNAEDLLRSSWEDINPRAIEAASRSLAIDSADLTYCVSKFLFAEARKRLLYSEKWSTDFRSEKDYVDSFLDRGDLNAGLYLTANFSNSNLFVEARYGPVGGTPEELNGTCYSTKLTYLHIEDPNCPKSVAQFVSEFWPTLDAASIGHRLEYDIFNRKFFSEFSGEAKKYAEMVGHTMTGEEDMFD